MVFLFLLLLLLLYAHLWSYAASRMMTSGYSPLCVIPAQSSNKSSPVSPAHTGLIDPLLLNAVPHKWQDVTSESELCKVFFLRYPLSLASHRRVSCPVMRPRWQGLETQPVTTEALVTMLHGEQNPTKSHVSGLEADPPQSWASRLPCSPSLIASIWDVSRQKHSANPHPYFRISQNLCRIDVWLF